MWALRGSKKAFRWCRSSCHDAMLRLLICGSQFCGHGAAISVPICGYASKPPRETVAPPPPLKPPGPSRGPLSRGRSGGMGGCACGCVTLPAAGSILVDPPALTTCIEKTWDDVRRELRPQSTPDTPRALRAVSRSRRHRRRGASSDGARGCPRPRISTALGLGLFAAHHSRNTAAQRLVFANGFADAEPQDRGRDILLHEKSGEENDRGLSWALLKSALMLTSRLSKRRPQAPIVNARDGWLLWCVRHSG